MLTGYQTEVVAFFTDGDIICYDCAHKALDQGDFDRSERGLGSLSPIIRYSLDELNSQRVYDEAEQQYADDPGNGDDSDREHWQIIEDIVESLGDSYNEACGHCGEVIS